MLNTIRGVAKRWQRRRSFEHIRRVFARNGIPLDHVDDLKIEAALTGNGSRRLHEVVLTTKTIYRAQRRLARDPRDRTVRGIKG